MNGRADEEELIPRRKAILKSDLNTQYAKMAENLRAGPQSIGLYKEIYCKVLKPYAETHGELLISNDGKKVYFARDGTPFTDFGVVPLAVIRMHFTDHMQEYVELLVLGKEVPPKYVKIDAKILGSSQWIEELGIAYIYEKSAIWQLKILIQAMVKYAPVKDEFLYMGWAPNNSNFYIMDGHKLCGDDWHIDYAKTSCEHTLQMLDVAPHSITVALLAISILSLVQSRMVHRGIYFKGVCGIVAPTQSFKTTLASLFLDFTDGRKADINFEASVAAIIRTIGKNRDMTVILDDYKPGATKAECNDMLLKISKVIRLCSDDSGGIKRAGIQNEIITNIAQCLVVVTAEHIHFDVQSTFARFLILEMSRKSVDKDKLTYFQENHFRYRECIENFIKYISKLGVDRFCEQLEQRFLKERNALQMDLLDQNILVDSRSNDMCVWLYIAFSEFLKYANSIQAIKQERTSEWMKESEGIFRSLMVQQAGRVAELDDVQLFFSGLQVLIETREVHIGELQSRNTNYATRDSKSAIGFRKKGYVYLKNDVAFQKVASYFQRCGKEFTISETGLRKKLEDNDYINRKDEKTYIHRLFVNHESYQCIQFDKVKFDELLKGGKRNESAKKEIPSDRGLWENANAILGR